MIQLVIILYVGLYALWLQRGYQEFANVESSVTIKIKGVTKSVLDEHSTENEGKSTATILVEPLAVAVSEFTLK